MTTTRDDLLRAVLAEPDSDEPRLVFADWLEEHGDAADLARAEFVRVQVEIARMEEAGEGDVDEFEGHTCTEAHCPVCALVDRMDLLRRRERELRGPVSFASGAVHRESLWVEEAFGPDRVHARPGNLLVVRSWEFRRGFVEAVTLDAASWIAHGDDLLAAAPLREVRLQDWPDYVRVHDDLFGSWYTLVPDTPRGVHIFRGEAEPVIQGDIQQRLLHAEWPGPDGRLRFVLPT